MSLANGVRMSAGTRFRIWYAAQPRALRALLAINVVLYLAWNIPLRYIAPVNSFFYAYLALHPQLPDLLFRPWQLVTYNFLHLGPGLGGLLHVAFNMLWLVWVGRDFEETHGSERHLAVYLLAGAGGGLFSLLLNGMFPSSGIFAGPIVGASASVLGVVSCVAFLYPHKRIGLLFIGPVRLIHLVAALLILDLLFMAGSSTAVGAHFGGVLTGFLLSRALSGGVDIFSWSGLFLGRRGDGRTGRSPASGGSFLTRLDSWLAGRRGSARESRPTARVHPLHRDPSGRPPERSPDAPDVDRILDKISEEGYDALTEDEKRILYEASQK